MPRVTIAAVETIGGYPTAGVVAAETASDASNKQQTSHTGKNFILIARNSGSTTRAITISSIADASQGRTGDIVTTLTSAQRKVFGPFAIDGWRQADLMLYFEAAHAEVVWSVIKF